MGGLTERQKEVLDFIKDHIEEYGIAPTFVEIGDAVGCSISVAWGHADKLAHKKFISWPRKGLKRKSSRSIKVRGKCPYCGGVVR